MKKSKLIILTLALLTTSITACNKEKRYSNKLIKGSSWDVTSINVDGNSIHTSSVWHVTQDVNIYDKVPEVLWENDTSSTIFNWQFQDKGKLFELEYKHDTTECDSNTLTYLDYLCYDISGKYEVKTHKRKEMSFTSNQTETYPNQTVEINIKKR